MTIVGFTGHQNLTPATRLRVTAAMAQRLADLQHDDLIGLTSLAAGADQAFAFCILAAGGRIKAVVPARGYRDTMVGQDQRHYDHLLALAADISELAFPTPTESAYFAAGRFIVDRCGLLLAAWDGQPAGGLGGTGDVVTYARQRGVAVKIVWPYGSSRV
jgi:hypothetical protein